MVRTPTGGEDTERPNEQQTDGRRAPISDGDTKWRELLNSQYEVIKIYFSNPFLVKDFLTKKPPSYSTMILFWT